MRLFANVVLDNCVVALLILALTGCGTSRVPTRPTSEASSSASPTTVTTASPLVTVTALASAAVSEGTDAGEALTEPPRKLHAVLRQLCGLAKQGDRLGCSCCPPFEDCPAKPGDRSVAATEPAWTPQVVHFGSFTAPGVEEVVLGSDFSCGHNLGSYGRVVLARYNGARWRLSSSFIDSLQHATSIVRDDGRALLVVVALLGKTPFYRLQAWDYSQVKDGRPKATELASWVDDARKSCIVGSAPGDKVSESKLVSVELADRKGGGGKEVVVTVDVHAGLPDAKFKRACKGFNDALEKDSTEPDVAAALPKKRFRLVFPFDGKTLGVSTSGVREMNAFLSTSP